MWRTMLRCRPSPMSTLSPHRRRFATALLLAVAQVPLELRYYPELETP